MLFLTLIGLLGVGLVVDLADSDDDDQVGSDGSTPPTEFADDVIGTDGDDSLFAKGGNDLVVGGDGDDRLFGGDGIDAVLGEAGDDFLRGGEGDDLVFGGAGEDTLNGDQGDDFLYSADILDERAYIDGLVERNEVDFNTRFDMDPAEADTVIGGAGDDQLVLGGNDTGTGNDGNDIFFTGLWMDADDHAVVTDFEPGEDILAYAYDEELPEPTFSFAEGEDENDAQVLVNDETAFVLRNIDYQVLSTLDIIAFPVDART